MAARKQHPVEFSLPEKKGLPTPELCPSCQDVGDPVPLQTVGGNGVWRCDLCGFKFVAGYFYWKWLDEQM